MFLTKFEREIRLKEILTKAKRTNIYPNKIELAKELGMSINNLLIYLKKMNSNYSVKLYNLKDVKNAIKLLKKEKHPLTISNVVNISDLRYETVKYCFEFLGVKPVRKKTMGLKKLKSIYGEDSEKLIQILKEKRELENFKRRILRGSKFIQVNTSVKLKPDTLEKIKQAIIDLNQEGKKVSVLAISRKTKLCRETVKKYKISYDLN